MLNLKISTKSKNKNKNNTYALSPKGKGLMLKLQNFINSRYTNKLYIYIDFIIFGLIFSYFINDLLVILSHLIDNFYSYYNISASDILP